MAYRKIIPTVLPRMHLRYRGHISKREGPGGRRERKGKENGDCYLSMSHRRVGRHARLSNFIFRYFSKRRDGRCTDRAIENVTVSFSPRARFLLYCFIYFFFSFGNRRNRRSAANEHSASAPCIFLRGRLPAISNVVVYVA